MLIYEKDNKLNISFENNMEETDIEIGKDEVKIGEATISENNVLPVPEEGDTGKVPTVQEDGSYALANAGGSSTPLICTITGDTLDKTWNEINSAMASGKVVLAVEAVAGEFALHYFATGCQSFHGTYNVTYIAGRYSQMDGKIFSSAIVFKASSATGTLTQDKQGLLEYTVVT